MAPSVQTTNITTTNKVKKDETISYDVNLPYKAVDAGHAKGRTEFPEYLPIWDDKEFHPEIDEFEYDDPALHANQLLPSFYRPGVTLTDITPKMGTIISGISLSEVDDAAKNELAFLISHRKVVVFRDQLDFLNKGPGFQQDFMAYFGKPNIQPVTGSVKGQPGFHIIHRYACLTLLIWFVHPWIDITILMQGQQSRRG